jgi:hypothetical protein
MPAKRVIFVSVGPGKTLHYALRVDVPEGAEVVRRPYNSIYGDSLDPDVAAIRAGTVREEVRSREAFPQPGETDQEALVRIQGELEVEWQALQDTESRKLVRTKAVGRFWDGTTWQKWERPS